MSFGDPFPGRCRRCGIGLMDPVDDCGRGDCRTLIEALRVPLAAIAGAVHRAARWLGLAR